MLYGCDGVNNNESGPIGLECLDGRAAPLPSRISGHHQRLFLMVGAPPLPTSCQCAAEAMLVCLIAVAIFMICIISF